MDVADVGKRVRRYAAARIRANEQKYYDIQSDRKKHVEMKTLHTLRHMYTNILSMDSLSLLFITTRITR